MELSNKNTAKKIISGTLSMTISSLIVKLVGLAYKIPLSYILSDEGMGYFNSAYTVYSFFYLISVAGVPKAITILISDAEAKAEMHQRNKIYSSSIKAFGIFGLVSSTVLCLMADTISNFIGNPLSKLTVIMIAPSILFTAISGVIRGYLCAYMKFTNVAISQMLDAILKTLFGIALAMLGVVCGYEMHIVSALTILGATLGTVISTIYLVIISKNHNNSNKAGQNCQKMKGYTVIKKVLRISFPITLSAATLSLTNIVDLLLVMKRLVRLGYSTSLASALYGNYTTLVVPMIGLSVALITPVAISVMPALTSAFSRNDTAEFKEHLNFAMKIAAFVSLPISFGLTFYSNETLTLVFEDTDATVAAPLLSVAATSVVFMSLLSVVNSAIESAGVVNVPIYSMLVGGIFKVFISYYMIGSNDFGIFGAPVGTTVCYAIALIVSISLLNRKCGFRLSILRVVFVPFFSSCFMILISKSVMAHLNKYIGGALYSSSCILLCFLLYVSFAAILYKIYGKSRVLWSKCTKKRYKSYEI